MVTMQNMGQLKEKIVTNARKKLETAQNLPEDYKDHLQSLANSLCPICKSPLEIIEVKGDENSSEYKYECGHGLMGITFKEEIKIHEGIGIKQMGIERRKWVKKMYQGYKSSGNPSLSGGVHEISVYDRENDWIDKVVKDNITGKILDEHHEPLTKHKPHSKMKPLTDS